MGSAPPLDLSPGEWAVLGAVAQGPTHGFAIATLLGPGGELGRVWTLPRPVVYQVIKKLVALGLLDERSTERSDRGPVRTILGVSPAGRKTLKRWLREPVDHVRDVRSMLLLKLALLDRGKGDSRPLITAQRQKLAEVKGALEGQREVAAGFERVLVEWRLASSQATLEFLDALEATASTPTTP